MTILRTENKYFLRWIIVDIFIGKTLNPTPNVLREQIKKENIISDFIIILTKATHRGDETTSSKTRFPLV